MSNVIPFPAKLVARSEHDTVWSPVVSSTHDNTTMLAETVRERMSLVTQLLEALHRRLAAP